MPDTNEEGATIWAERIRTALAEATFVAAERRLRLSASFGVAQRGDDVPGPHDLLHRADEAMSVAKQAGRNRTVRFTSIANPLASGLADIPKSLDLFHGVSAHQVMTSPVACLPCDATAGMAAEYFLEARVNSAPVVDGAGKLVGILSEKDVMWTMLWTDSWTKPVREIMQPNVVSYAEDTPMQAIFDFLCRVTIRRVVVVRDGEPTGVISRASLLRWFTNWVASHQPPGAAPAIAAPAGASPAVAAALRGVRGGDPPHPRLTKAAEALLELAERLLSELNDEDQDDLIPPVVAGVSKMQELMNDLLAYSRFVHTAPPAAARACRAAGREERYRQSTPSRLVR